MNRSEQRARLNAFISKPPHIDGHPRYDVLTELTARGAKTGIAVEDFEIRPGRPPVLLNSSERVTASFLITRTTVQALFHADGTQAHPDDDIAGASMQTLFAGTEKDPCGGLLIVTDDRLVLNLMTGTALLGIAPYSKGTQLLVGLQAGELATAAIGHRHGKPTRNVFFTGRWGNVRTAIGVEVHKHYDIETGRQKRIRPRDLQDQLTPAMDALNETMGHEHCEWFREGGDLVYPLPAHWTERARP